MATKSTATKRQTSNLPVDYQAQLSKEATSIASRIGTPSGNVIKGRPGKGFTFPDGTEVESLSVVIVDFLAMNAYYDRPYDPSNLTPPACYAIGEAPEALVPAENSPDQQASSCAGCANNVFESGVGKGKACRNGRILAVMVPEAVDDPDAAEIFKLNVAPSSLKSFDNFVASLANKHKTIPIGVVARVDMDPNVTYIKMGFSLERALDPKTELKTFFESREAARQLLETPPDVSQYEPPPKTGQRPKGRGR